MDADQWRPLSDDSDTGHVRPPRRTRSLTPAIAVSLVLFAASAALALSFVVATGGLHLAGPLPTDTAVVASPSSESASPSTQSTEGPTSAATPEPSLTSTPIAQPSQTPAATSDRYQFLEACPSKPLCYLYTVQPGNNLRSIANYFGVAYETVLALNPAITTPDTILPGDVIVLPPPTR